MEEASRVTGGVSLAELAERLDAPKSSIQELTNGLLATGYLVERDRRFTLGPGPFVLSIRTVGLSLRQIEQQFVHKRLLEEYHLPRLSLFYMSQA